MQRSTFKVLFYVKRQSEKHGQVPVMGRITINGTMSQFSCKLSVRSSLWDAKANKASGKSLESQRINEKLENIKTNIGKQYQRLCDRDSYVTAEKVRNAFLGMGDDCRLLLQTFDEYLAEFRKRVGKDRAYSTYEDYCLRRRRLAAFLEYEYHVKDIPFKELKRDFIEKFVVYLSAVKGLASGTISAGVKKLRLMTYTAYKNGWISRRSFRRVPCQAQIRRTTLFVRFGTAGRHGRRTSQLPYGHQPGCLRFLRLYGSEPFRHCKADPCRYSYRRQWRLLDHRQAAKDRYTVPCQTSSCRRNALQAL